MAAEGADWVIDNILDPACGGGAFLITVANRMLGDYRIKGLPAEAKMSNLEQHLVGMEINKFAGWITQVLLDIVIFPEAVIVNRSLKTIINVQDTIQLAYMKSERLMLL